MGKRILRDFRCSDCGKEQEHFTDLLSMRCECGGHQVPMLAAPAVQFKGIKATPSMHVKDDGSSWM